MTVYLMSTTIVPQGADGTWTMRGLSVTEAADYIIGPSNRGDLLSAVGHDSTAEAMSELLGREVRANRITVRPEVGDEFVCFRLLSRPPEGAILDRTELERIGYEFALMRYISSEELRPRTGPYGRGGTWGGGHMD